MDTGILIEQWHQQDWIEWIGLITGIFYVLLAAYEKPSCWIFGIISCAAIGWKSFVDYKLIADGILQLFYIVIGVVGLYQWVLGRQADRPKPIVTSKLLYHIAAIAFCLVISKPLSVFLIQVADARYGYPDTVLMLLSVYATYLLVRKDLHTWIYWMVIDAAYVFLYLKTDALLFALLFLIYTGMSVVGYFRWKRTKAQRRMMNDE